MLIAMFSFSVRCTVLVSTAVVFQRAANGFNFVIHHCDCRLSPNTCSFLFLITECNWSTSVCMPWHLDCLKRIKNGSFRTEMDVTTFVIVLRHFVTHFYKILFSWFFSSVVLSSVLLWHLLTYNLLSPPFPLPFRPLLSPNFLLLFINLVFEGYIWVALIMQESLLLHFSYTSWHTCSPNGSLLLHLSAQHQLRYCNVATPNNTRCCFILCVPGYSACLLCVVVLTMQVCVAHVRFYELGESACCSFMFIFTQSACRSCRLVCYPLSLPAAHNTISHTVPTAVHAGWLVTCLVHSLLREVTWRTK